MMRYLHTLRPGARFELRGTKTTGTLVSKTPSAANVRYDDEPGNPAPTWKPTIAIALNSEVEEIR